MDAQELRALQEAYSQVYELDENRMASRMGKMPSAPAKVGKATHSIKDLVPSKAPSPKEKAKARKALGLGEAVDLYDIILSHLLDEGYAETPEAAEAIMVNMSEDWRESICDEVLDEKTASPAPRYNIRKGLDAKSRRLRRSSDFYTYGGENQDPDERTISTSKGEGGITKNPKKLRKQQIMGEH